MSIPGIQGREATTAAVVASPSRRSTGLRPIHRWRRRRKPGRARARRGHSGSGRAEQKRRRVERGQRRQRAARAGGTSAVGRRAAESGFRRMRRQQVVGAGDLVHHATEAGGVSGDVGGGQLPRRARAAFRGAATGCGSRGAEVVVVVRRRRGGGRRLGRSGGGREVAEELVMVVTIGKDGEPWRRRRGGGGGWQGRVHVQGGCGHEHPGGWVCSGGGGCRIWRAEGDEQSRAEQAREASGMATGARCAVVYMRGRSQVVG